jgi:hypothetical protein
MLRVYTRCVQVPLGFIFLNFALQFHRLASCGVKILEVSAVAVYNFKEQTSLHLECNSTVLTPVGKWRLNREPTSDFV